MQIFFNTYKTDWLVSKIRLYMLISNNTQFSNFLEKLFIQWTHILNSKNYKKIP